MSHPNDPAQPGFDARRFKAMERAGFNRIAARYAEGAHLRADLAEALLDAAALKVPPGDAAALAKALARLIDAPAERRQRADAAWTAAGDLTRWSETARIVAQACLRDSGRKVG